MTFNDWLAFAIATFFICISPGPNMLSMLASGVKYGFKRTFFTMAGCFLGVLLLIAGSVAGVGLLLEAQPNLFAILRTVGAAYLIYLGIMGWRAPVSEQTQDEVDLSSVLPSKLFSNGFWVAMSNPKALLFAAAFFPQFINPDAPQLPQMIILLVTFTVLEIACYSAYALGGVRLSAYLQRVSVRRTFNRMTGGLFILFGAVLLIR